MPPLPQAERAGEPVFDAGKFGTTAPARGKPVADGGKAAGPRVDNQVRGVGVPIGREQVGHQDGLRLPPAALGRRGEREFHFVRPALDKLVRQAALPVWLRLAALPEGINQRSQNEQDGKAAGSILDDAAIICVQVACQPAGSAHGNDGGK